MRHPRTEIGKDPVQVDWRPGLVMCQRCGDLTIPPSPGARLCYACLKNSDKGASQPPMYVCKWCSGPVDPATGSLFLDGSGAVVAACECHEREMQHFVTKYQGGSDGDES